MSDKFQEEVRPNEMDGQGSYYKRFGAVLVLIILLLMYLYHLQHPYYIDHAFNAHVPNQTLSTKFSKYDIRGFVWEKESKAALKLGDGLWIYPSRRVYNVKTIKESQLLNYLVQRQILCDRHYRAGNSGDGGWDVCLVGNFKPRTSGCLVYSFGINYDFTFDDAMAKQFNCTVYAFDPSMKRMQRQTKRGTNVFFIPEGLGSSKTVNNKKWKLDTLDGFMDRFGHSKHIIDYLKMDIEHAEYDAIPQMIKSGKFSQVKQFGLEVHRRVKVYKDGPNTGTSKIYSFLQSLEEEGFRTWHMHYNPHCAYATHFGMKTSLCIEIYLLNKKFIRT